MSIKYEVKGNALVITIDISDAAIKSAAVSKYIAEVVALTTDPNAAGAPVILSVEAEHEGEAARKVADEIALSLYGPNGLAPYVIAPLPGDYLAAIGAYRLKENQGVVDGHTFRIKITEGSLQ